MTTKTYRGRTIAELLPQIRAELGEDAIIVNQREGLAGGLGGFFQRTCVELEAAPAESAPALIDVHDDEEPAMPPAYEPDPADDFEPTTQADERLRRFADQMEMAQAQTPPAPAFRPTVSAQVSSMPDAAFVPAVYDELSRPAPPLPAAMPVHVPSAAPAATSTSAAWPAQAHAALDALAESGLGAELSTQVVTHALTDLAPFAPGAPARGDAGSGADVALTEFITQALAHRIPVAPLHAAPGRAIAFVGPGGAGKTRCIVAIATAYATRADLPVACIALRARDGGAELQRELGPAGVTVRGARDVAEACDHVESLRGHCLVLVDTPAISPRAQAEMRILARELHELRLDEVHLTLPATTGPVAARELVTGTAPLNVSALALTHADETGALGPSIAIAVESGLPLSFVSRGALRPAVAHELAAAVLA